MSYDLIIKPAAEKDLLEIAQWYEEKKEGLGIQFLDSVDEKVETIQTNPNLFQIRYKSIRLALVSRFPYLIHYFVEDQKIYVIAVLSASRDPEIWKDR